MRTRKKNNYTFNYFHNRTYVGTARFRFGFIFFCVFLIAVIVLLNIFYMIQRSSDKKKKHLRFLKVQTNTIEVKNNKTDIKNGKSENETTTTTERIFKGKKSTESIKTKTVEKLKAKSEAQCKKSKLIIKLKRNSKNVKKTES